VVFIAAARQKVMTKPVPARATGYFHERPAPPFLRVALVPWLGRGLAMSERTLRRRFDESFGYGPKTLDRILRYQRFLRQVRLSQGSPAILAVEAGYCDQPHLVRESRRLAGCTPLEVGRTMKRVAIATNAECRLWRLNGNGELGISPVISRNHTMWRSPLPDAVLRQVGGLLHIISLFLKRIEPRRHALVVLPRRRLAGSG
jgi:AraC-like DNA-binding protein